MTKTKKRKSKVGPPQLGHLPRQYKFFLNPYTNARFTSCPKCDGKMKLRKLPLAIHVCEWGMVMMNKTCRFCPACELLIAHRDEIEAQLSNFFFAEINPRVITNEFLVVGTIERSDWRRGKSKPPTTEEMRAALHDFEEVVKFEPARCWDLPTGRPVDLK